MNRWEKLGARDGEALDDGNWDAVDTNGLDLEFLAA